MSKLPPKRNLRNVALFAEVEVGVSPAEATVPLVKIDLPARQPRRYFSPEAMQSLITSIKQDGILQPLLVRPFGDKYELVAGERRYRAAQAIGLEYVPVTIRELTDSQAKLLALTENLQREDLNPVEETEGILELLSLKLAINSDEVISLLNRLDHLARGNVKGESEESAHNVMGKKEIEETFSQLGLTWQSFLKNRLPLLNLPNELLEALRSGQIEYTKAKMIATLKNQQQRKTLLEFVINQHLSLSQIKEQVEALKSTVLEISQTPQKTLDNSYRRVRQAQLWKNPKKWRKLQTLLEKIEALIQEED